LIGSNVQVTARRSVC